MRLLATRSARATAAWSLIVIALLALRLPAVAEPAGNDQSLYMYVADEVRHGGVPYVDAWDQKPPAIFFLYAALRSVWPDESAVAVADLLGASAISLLIFVLARRAIGGHAGGVSASVFALFSHPSFSRLSGVYLRGQCEVFIAVAVSAALVLAWRRRHRRAHLLLAGVWLGVAVWFKYNALAYAAPVGVVLIVASDDPFEWPAFARRVGWMAFGAAVVSVTVLAYFIAHGAVDALRLATIDYNLQYSRETYTSGVFGAIGYVYRALVERGRGDFLWYLGLSGAGLLVISGWRSQPRLMAAVVAWLAAAVLSIAVNGARNLPQYFVQAGPALAFACAAGYLTAWRRGRAWQVAVVLVLAAGLWRVGVDERRVLGLRWGALPQLVESLRLDVGYLRGRVARSAYLAHFKGEQKYDALAVEDLATDIMSSTGPEERILVFGFAPGVYLESQRRSASRFFWSRPVILNFAAAHEGYGPRGLLADLERTRPAVIALQKKDWGPMDPNSEAFFMEHQDLHDFLVSRYVLARDTPIFAVWKRIG